MMKEPLSQKVKNWVNERTGLVKFVTDFLHEEIPGGTRFSYTLGSACMFLLSIQIITGIWQLFYYVPTVDYAYSSLNYLRLQVPFGWLVHGLHYWGGTAFTIVVGLHVMRVFIWGSYKKPRELVWFFGIGLIVMTALFMFTGPVLPWDKKGYWAGQVGIGIAGSVPVVGPFTQLILQGASKMGQSALMRIYVMHVALIPFLTGLLVTLHLIAFRQFGEAGPWEEKKRKTVGYFWPEQIFKDVLVAFLLFLLLVFLSAFFPPEFSGLADPMDTLYTPKPEWNFLFLYQILKFLPGPLEPLGTAGIPLVIILLMASLPFTDRTEDRNPFKRGFVILGGFVFVAAVLYFTWLGYIYKSEAERANTTTAVEFKSNVNSVFVNPNNEIMLANSKKDVTGEQLFKTLGCTECHTANGSVSNKQGPDLVMARGNNRSHQWMLDQINAPQSHNKKTIMPPYLHLTHRNVELLVAYLEGLTPKEVPMPVAPAPVVTGGAPTDSKVLIEYGEQLFNTQGCTQCHTIQGRPNNKQGPDLIMAVVKRKPSKEWLHEQLMTPQAHNPLTIMPSYANRLKDPQMDAVVEFLSSLLTRKPSAAPAMDSSDQEKQTGSVSGLGEAVNIIGDREHGSVLFHQSCIMCHGPNGNNKTPGFVAPKGVPALNPINSTVYNANASTFVQRIDVYLQHGIPNTVAGGPNMPSFGDTHALTQAQIADLEAYVLSLNGVDRTRIINPGIEPKEFFLYLLELSLVVVVLSLLYWWIIKLIKF
ncbi:MAG: cytochrome b N-terminal domain-containing protein [Candidatus Omnitrophica bacterium]|nr:cytochrome b N-terminal domain-containing protein [Candidatus Omnitrophota bacterium]